MTIRFLPVALAEIQDSIRQHLTSLPSAIDSFLEDHIIESRHYEIRVGEEIAQFALATSFKQAGQSIYTCRDAQGFSGTIPKSQPPIE